MEKKAPKQPRFVQPLQNAEITEGQRLVSLSKCTPISIIENSAVLEHQKS